MGNKGSKKKWVAIEITKVKLNPEQAVLACCNALRTAVVPHVLSTQCGAGVNCGDWPGYDAISS